MTAQLEDARQSYRDPLQVGRVLSDTLGIITRNILPFAVLTAPILGAYAGYFYYLIGTTGVASFVVIAGGQFDGTGVLNVLFWQIPIYILAIACFNASLLYAYGKRHRLRKTLFAAFLAGLWRLPSVLLIWILLSVLPILALLACTTVIMAIPMPIWMLDSLAWLALLAIGALCFPFVLATPICLIEKKGPFAALGQSARLTRDYRWRLFGLLLLGAIIGFLLSLALLLVMLIFQLVPIAGPIASLLAMVMAPTLCLAWSGSILAMGYDRLSSIKNGIPPADIANVFE
jgi:hypothetical protein